MVWLKVLLCQNLFDFLLADWTPPKRGTTRRSLVDEESDLNCSALETIMDELQRHPASWPFSRAVSKKAVSILNFFRVANFFVYFIYLYIFIHEERQEKASMD